MYGHTFRGNWDDKAGGRAWVASVLGHPFSLDNSKARAFCACSRCGWGSWVFFYHLSFPCSFSPSLGDCPMLTGIPSQRAVKPKTSTNQSNPKEITITCKYLPHSPVESIYCFCYAPKQTTRFTSAKVHKNFHPICIILRLKKWLKTKLLLLFLHFRWGLKALFLLFKDSHYQIAELIPSRGICICYYS